MSSKKKSSTSKAKVKLKNLVPQKSPKGGAGSEACKPVKNYCSGVID